MIAVKEAKITEGFGQHLMKSPVLRRSEISAQSPVPSRTPCPCLSIVCKVSIHKSA